MRFPGKKQRPKAPEPEVKAPGAKGKGGQGGGLGRPGGPARIRRMEKELRAMRSRLAALEQEVQESRQLNKRLAEITDVVAEVLLPAEQRDDERLRTILRKYESAT